MRNIAKFIDLEQGVKAGHYIGQDDVRRYEPPKGYCATAELIDCHPLTGKPFGSSQWWVFLTPMQPR